MPDPHIEHYALPLPPPFQAIFEQAAGCASRGDWVAAGEAILRLRNAAPDSVHVLVLASMVMLRLDRYRDAHASAMQAARLPIDHPELLMQVVRSLRRFEEPEVLERLVAASNWRASRSAPLLAELALHLGSSGLYRLAFECLDHALDIAPSHADAHYLRGLFEMFSGRSEASVASLRHALSIEPRMANTHWLLSMQEDPGTAQAHIDEMLRVLPAIRPGTEAQAYLFYSLHHSLDAVGRHDEAWRALEHGHAVMRRISPYQREQQDALFTALRNMVLPAYRPQAMPGNGTGLIFIVGMFRSGTTLIERILAGHPEVVDGGETYQFSARMREATDHGCDQVIDPTIVVRAVEADFDVVRQRMQAYANWRSGGRRWLTEKLPSNFLNLGFILHTMPEAKILHMRRDPVETCFSNLRTIFTGAAPYACNQQDLSSYYLQYRALMGHWHAIAPGRILDVDYADIVADPAAQAGRIMDYCGLDFIPETIDLGRQGGTAATASAAHVRKGILTNRGSAWKPYAQDLQPLIRGLQGAYETDSRNPS